MTTHDINPRGEATWLTQEAYDRMQAELEYLEGPARDEIVARISAARDEGDLKENGGYHAAREEQSKNEGRILQLREKLRNVQVGAPPDDGLVEQGMVVEVELSGKPLKFLLGSREMAGVTDVNVYSPTSPLGKAVNGQNVGDTVTYETPAGKMLTAKILGATPYSG
ncbi:MAG: transcription elongation factor GreA [Promicromonosporaceae bacterium]|nr:transcription elongation factor GreA [Promicromonosporaceae bacterium]